ncbi:Mu transposase C-terminal domain-containing protein [Streptomyces globisporus]|uniref:Mu transposase C-terminal domain-containing protein n=1 Tax=Streptomyces globisporus TaxID=1908 RepID=UPI0036FAEFFD
MPAGLPGGWCHCPHGSKPPRRVLRPCPRPSSSTSPQPPSPPLSWPCARAWASAWSRPRPGRRAPAAAPRTRWRSSSACSRGTPPRRKRHAERERPPGRTGACRNCRTCWTNGSPSGGTSGPRSSCAIRCCPGRGSPPRRCGRCCWAWPGWCRCRWPGSTTANCCRHAGRALTDSGIRLGGRRYDDACLDEHRGRGRRWEVHHHPHDPRQVFVRLPDGLLHVIGWADGEHTLRPFDETVRRRTGSVLTRRGAGAQPGSETSDGSSETGRSADVAAVEGIADGMMVHDADGGGAGDRIARDTGGFGVYDPQAEAELW